MHLLWLTVLSVHVGESGWNLEPFQEPCIYDTYDLCSGTFWCIPCMDAGGPCALCHGTVSDVRPQAVDT